MPAERAFSRDPGGFNYADSFEMPLRRQDLTLRFNLFAESDNEIITRADDKHLDFRVSLLRLDSRIVLSTAVTTHNRFGRIYISLLAPLHRFCVMTIMSKAVATGRL